MILAVNILKQNKTQDMLKQAECGPREIINRNLRDVAGEGAQNKTLNLDDEFTILDSGPHLYTTHEILC